MCGAAHNHLIRPHFFEERLDGKTYFHFLEGGLPNYMEDSPFGS